MRVSVPQPLLTGNIHPIASACNASATVPHGSRGWRRDRGLASVAHRGRGAVKRKDGTAGNGISAGSTIFITPAPVPVAAPALSTTASFPLLTRDRGRASGSATGKIPPSSQRTPCPESHNADIPKRCLRHPREGRNHWEQITLSHGAILRRAAANRRFFFFLATEITRAPILYLEKPYC